MEANIAYTKLSLEKCVQEVDYNTFTFLRPENTFEAEVGSEIDKYFGVFFSSVAVVLST